LRGLQASCRRPPGRLHSGPADRDHRVVQIPRARPPVADEELRDELFRRRDLDQAAQARVRTAAGPQGQVTPDAQEAFEELQALNGDNTEWLKEVVRTRGWPGRSLVGYRGADAAWLLAQHADGDTAFQRECLELLEKAVEQGEAPTRTPRLSHGP